MLKIDYLEEKINEILSEITNLSSRCDELEEQLKASTSKNSK